MSRIAIVDRAKLRVVDRARRTSVDLGALGDGRLANRQPAWSPDGARLAWSAFDRRQVDSPSALAVATPEGTSRVDHPAVFPPFYLAWRGDGRAVATLAEGPLGLELAVVDVQSGVTEIVHRAAPLYFAWGPGGLLAIHGDAGAGPALELRGDGVDTERFAALRPGSFRAPAFAGGSVLAVVDHQGRDVLARIGRDATVLDVVGPAEHGARFVVDRNGTRLASTGERVPGPLVVHDLERGETRLVDDRPPALFQWSPDARSLLVARVVERGDFPRLEWSVWCDGERRVLTEVRSTATFAREVLPFHDQFARSHAWWSPDSRSVALAVVDDFGNDTIQVIDTGTGRSERAGTGSLVVWSPA
jgi:hypothetical protein